MLDIFSKNTNSHLINRVISFRMLAIFCKIPKLIPPEPVSTCKQPSVSRRWSRLLAVHAGKKCKSAKSFSSLCFGEFLANRTTGCHLCGCTLCLLLIGHFRTKQLTICGTPRSIPNMWHSLNLFSQYGQTYFL